jgi:bifunctional enzyme CysN/CysC
LEDANVAVDGAEQPFRFPVQWVNRPNLDFRGYAGTIASGHVSVGDEVMVATTGRSSTVKEIVTFDGSLPSASAGQAITLLLTDDVDISRGNMLCHSSSRPEVSQQFAANIVWMSEEPLVPGRSHLLRIGTKITPASITTLKHKIDPNTNEHIAAHTLEMNDIAVCNLSTSLPVALDPYHENRLTGSFIIIDRISNQTVGAGMILFGLRRGANVHWQPLLVDKVQRAAIKQQRPAILWFTGLSGAGKSTVANLVEQRLNVMGRHTMLLDGDNLRQGLSRDLGFTETDRVENIRRAGEVAKLLTDSGLVVLCSFISPYRADRDMVRNLVPEGEFIEIFVDTPIEECTRRDPKGLYAKAKAGQIKNFTGFDAPYELPLAPELHLRTTDHTSHELAEHVLDYMARKGVIAGS